jgi:hypothetical protein
MADIVGEAEVRLHRIRVKLYENHMAAIEGNYIAKTDTEATAVIPEVCASLKDRGLYHGDTAELARLFMLVMQEAMHMMCDGFGVNFHYFSIHPHVGGIFTRLLEGVSPDRHPIVFKFRVREPLRKLAERIQVFVVGLATSGAFLDEFTDIESGAVNEKATPGGAFIMTGVKEKIEGDPDETGFYLYSPGVPAIRTKVDKKLIENTPTKIAGILPDLPPNRIWYPEVRTQFAGSGKLLKEVRIIKADFTLAT